MEAKSSNIFSSKANFYQKTNALNTALFLSEILAFSHVFEVYIRFFALCGCEGIPYETLLKK